jgi:hypothetical protein
MSNTPTHQRNTGARLRRLAAALAAGAAGLVPLAGAGSVAAQPSDPPPWSVCAYRHHAAAADLGPLLPVNYDPPDELEAVLLGHVEVGTDCSIYDLPV